MRAQRSRGVQGVGRQEGKGMEAEAEAAAAKGEEVEAADADALAGPGSGSEGGWPLGCGRSGVGWGSGGGGGARTQAWGRKGRGDAEGTDHMTLMALDPPRRLGGGGGGGGGLAVHTGGLKHDNGSACWLVCVPGGGAVDPVGGQRVAEHCATAVAPKLPDEGRRVIEASGCRGLVGSLGVWWWVGGGGGGGGARVCGCFPQAAVRRRGIDGNRWQRESRTPFPRRCP